MMPTAPIWSDCQPRRYPRTTAALRADVAVIGAGLAGLSIAYHLLERRPGARVVVLEARRIGAGASGRSTGMLSPGVGQSLAALVRRQGRARARALYLATLRAVEDVRRLIEREQIDCGLAMTGQLVVALNPAGRSRLAANAHLMAELDLPCEPMDDAALDASIRLVRSRGMGGVAGLRLASAGLLDPMRLVCGLAQRVASRGGLIFEGSRVTAIGGRRPLRLEIDGGGEVVADHVVAATAGYSAGLGLLRGRVLPVHLQVVATGPLDARAREIIGWHKREGVIDSRRIFNYFRLTADDRIVFGGGKPRYRWGGPTDHDPAAPVALKQLARELKALFPSEAKLVIAGGWTGVIGYVLDTLPAIGWARGNRAVLHAVGWCGHGIALSVASGAWVTQMLCDGATPEDLPWYRNDPPLLPFETARWTGFRAAVQALAWLDTI